MLTGTIGQALVGPAELSPPQPNERDIVPTSFETRTTLPDFTVNPSCDHLGDYCLCDTWDDFLEWGEFQLGFDRTLATLYRRKALHESNLEVERDGTVRFKLIFRFLDRAHYITRRCFHGTPLNQTAR